MQPFADMFEGCIEVCSHGAKLHGGQQKDLTPHSGVGLSLELSLRQLMEINYPIMFGTICEGWNDSTFT